jgi:hypothetical protein
MEEKRYTSTHPLGHTGPVKGNLYLYFYIRNYFQLMKATSCFRTMKSRYTTAARLL